MVYLHEERGQVLEDRELIRRIQNGQKEYLNEIAVKYYDDIYYFCCYQTGSREDAYDLAQETFLRFIRCVEKYRYQNLKGYLLTIAMNLCRDYMRKTSGGSVSGRILAEGEISGNKMYSPELDRRTGAGGKSREEGICREELSSREYESRENKMLLAEALDRLPDTQREAVLLHHFYGYKNREIARMTGASCGTVKSRVKQGLEKLSRILDRKDFY